MEPQELYGLPLERFTEERNVLAKELRKDGRREEATEISDLRKPSVAAWAVNQLVRTQRRDVANLFEVGDALRQAQSQLLAGHGEADALRDAVEGVRTAVDQLTQRARGLLSSEGHELTSATLERVSETLNAAALDEDLRAQVSDGCLVRELHHVGLGGLGASAPSQPAARGKAQGARSKPGGARSKSAPKKRAERPQEKGPEPNETRSAEAAQARKGSAEAAQARKGSAQAAQARKAEAEARRRAVRTARELKTAQSRRDRAADEFRRTREALREAQAAVASAEEAAAGAIRELEELRRARDRG